MKKILIISTGGTFNKIYNPISGELTIDKDSKALDEISSKWLNNFNTINIIGKDSLDMTNKDRLELLATINQTDYSDIIIIHGTDTMNTTASYLADSAPKKKIILTGAMVPYSIDPIEAISNLTSSFGYLQNIQKNGIYIVMNGIFSTYNKIKKDRKKGKFILS